MAVDILSIARVCSWSRAFFKTLAVDFTSRSIMEKKNQRRSVFTPVKTFAVVDFAFFFFTHLDVYDFQEWWSHNDFSPHKFSVRR